MCFENWGLKLSEVFSCNGDGGLYSHLVMSIELNLIDEETEREMRLWLADCFFPDADPEEIEHDFSKEIIVKAVDRHWEGGVEDFIKVNFPLRSTNF